MHICIKDDILYIRAPDDAGVDEEDDIAFDLTEPDTRVTIDSNDSLMFILEQDDKRILFKVGHFDFVIIKAYTNFFLW